MKIITELPRGEFEKKFGDHRDIKYFGRSFKHCYLVSLTRNEFLSLGINSTPLEPFPGKAMLIQDAINQYIEDKKNLDKTHPDRGISGTTVKAYLEKFKQGMKLDNCFVQDLDDDNPDQLGKYSYYVTDGMHRLTAYGIYKNLKISDNEVQVYYSTDTAL